MSARKTSRTIQAIRTVVVVLAAIFAVLAAGCATQRVPGGGEVPAMPAPGVTSVAPLHTGA
ncbi:hypothetical protein H7H78_08700 [Mycobacterium shinjukuense]|uniref:Uncharacterized protein n=1 Tax=Mycobacterium shinjukuense TaxID=398694 RepID=A0A7I7MLQ7_9MYCO|nr:hypothetical protein [Mycobacterium shinjukuense]MCV6985508.1 hypothetical protein [Mycobacterium shinjukuense]ORB66564.1 hypothetical protein BST45_13470 [Mycobacterium shinjukuense]BBX72717.1 hypothetical protein MSHI_06230 [Mycobacterium shinjukuense]